MILLVMYLNQEESLGDLPISSTQRERLTDRPRADFKRGHLTRLGVDCLVGLLSMSILICLRRSTELTCSARSLKSLNNIYKTGKTQDDWSTNHR